MPAMLLAWLCFVAVVKTTSFIQPTATTPKNSTAVLSSALITDCPTKCYRDNTALAFVRWSQLSISTTITAATVVYVVNNGTNSTRTSTIYNTDIDNGVGSAPKALDSAGTKTATILRTESGHIVTHTVAYPTTAYYDYSSTYSMCGTFPTSIGTNRTCVTAQDCISSGFFPGLNTRASSYSFPSHPPMPDGIQRDVDMLNDPKGRTYVPVRGEDCSRPNPLQALFPNLNLWSCKPLDNCFDGRVHPMGPMAIGTALYLTATTTSTEDGTHGARPTESTPFSSDLGLPGHDGGENSRPASTMAAGMQSDIIAEPPPIIVPTSAPAIMKPADAGKGPAERPSPAAIADAMELFTTTNAEGNLVVISAPYPASSSEPSPSAPIIPGVPALGPEGMPLPSASFLPAMIFATENNHDSPSPLLPAWVLDKTPNLPGITAPPVVTVGSQVITANSMHQYIIQSQTLTPGGKITFSGTEISLPSDESALIVGDTTLPLHPPTITHPAVLMLGSGAVTANSLNQYIVDGQTLTPGGKITLSGTEVSLPSDGTALIVGDTIQPLHPPTITPPAVLTLGSAAVTANSFNRYIVDGQTLTPGGVITLSGTRISLSPDITALIVGSVATPLRTTAPPALTIGTQTIIANSNNQYIVDGQTLTPGGVITVSGTRVSLATDKTNMVIGTATDALGALITSGLRGAHNESSPQDFTGAAKKRIQISLHLECFILAVGLVVTMIL